MVNIIKEELPMEDGLKKKINLICEFAKVKPKIINGNIRKHWSKWFNNISKRNIKW